MSDDRDDSDKRPRKDAATGDSASASPSESPRDKKTRLSTTDSDASVPVSRARPLSAQDLLVAGRYTLASAYTLAFLTRCYLP